MINKINFKNGLGIYIHIPFCINRCRYCLFYSTSDLKKIDDYFSALYIEFDLYRNINYHVDTIYFGGGSPSLVNSYYIGKVLDKIYSIFNISSDVEITIEINPGNFSLKKLYDYYKVGINRLSIGAQSMDDSMLSYLGRSHSVLNILYILKKSREIGFNNISFDLIYNIHGQNLSRWSSELETFITFNVEHLSCYLLNYQPRSSIEKKMKSENLYICNLDLYLFLKYTSKILSKNYFIQYEVSNFSKKHETGFSLFESRHNKKYWNLNNYIGFGPSAHSYINNVRSWNYSSVNKYIYDLIKKRKKPTKSDELLSRNQKIIESIYLGLRQGFGLKNNNFENKFGIKIIDLLYEKIENLEYDGYVKVFDDKVTLTSKGYIYLDSIVLYIARNLT